MFDFSNLAFDKKISWDFVISNILCIISLLNQLHNPHNKIPEQNYQKYKE